MDNRTQDFVDFCKKEFDLNSSIDYNYHSLSVCVIDCIYSLRTKYYPVTVPIVERYAEAFMNGDKNASGDSLRDLLEHIKQCGGKEAFVEKIIKNHQKLGRGIPKEDIVVDLANKLIRININTIEDFQSFEDQELLETVIRSVKGIGDAGVNYLFMLAGDPNRCKPDVHIHQCIKDACGEDVTNPECQVIFTEAVKILKAYNDKLTVRQLDGIIWDKYQKKSRTEKN